jgi:alanine racemase
VAQALGDADGFAVARVEEGVALRHGGFRQRIVVLQGAADAHELEVAAGRHLDLVVHHPVHLDLLANHALVEPIAVWVKIDTGMQRLGFPATDTPAVAARLRDLDTVRKPLCWMSHLANADDRDDPLTATQLTRFLAALSDCEGERSIANSAGLLHWPACQLDWVRPGIMLYGVSPFGGVDGVALGLRPAMRLGTRLISVRQLRAGERVGYGGTWQAPRDTVLGVAAIGYGDGYPRHAPTGTPVLVNARRATLVGRVSMDMIALDISDQPEAQVGDPVEVWGPELPVETVAEWAGTIGYDLLAGLTARVRYGVG